MNSRLRDGQCSPGQLESDRMGQELRLVGVLFWRSTVGLLAAFLALDHRRRAIENPPWTCVSDMMVSQDEMHGR